MDNLKPVKPPVWYWVIVIILLLWAFVGVTFYYLEQTMSEAKYLEIYGQDLSEMRRRIPTWSTAAYAFGVWGGLLGVIGLLLRRKWATPVYIVSLFGALGAWGWNVADDVGRASLSEGGWVMLVLVIGLCIFQIVFARRMTAKGILR